MKTALIGATGFVGGTIGRQHDFDEQYNSSNIGEIDGKEFDLVVCAAAPGKKWQANQEPDKDKASITNLISHLKTIKTAYFVLISTIDVYLEPRNVDENTPIDSDKLQPYGRHRLELEDFVRKTFPSHSVIRLPGLFGPGLKKNFIFDMIQGKNLEMTNPKSVFQFYNMNNLWTDMQKVMDEKLSLVNFATEPLAASQVYAYVMGTLMTVGSDAPIASYDVHTVHASKYGMIGQYMYESQSILDQIRELVISTKENE